eukprot:s310_g5.t3
MSPNGRSSQILIDLQEGQVESSGCQGYLSERLSRDYRAWSSGSLSRTCCRSRSAGPAMALGDHSPAIFEAKSRLGAKSRFAGSFFVTLLGLVFGSNQRRLSEVTPQLASSGCCHFAKEFEGVDWQNPQTRAEFMANVMYMERKFLGRASKLAFDPDTGMTYDGVGLDHNTGDVQHGSLRTFSAPSKEALHLSLLALALQPIEDVPKELATVLPLLYSTDEALDILEKKAKTMEDFDAHFPGFGGFLPWFCTRGINKAGHCKTLDDPGARMTPLSGWERTLPGLDNGQLAFGTAAVVHVLEGRAKREGASSRFAKIASRWNARLERMKASVVNLFYNGAGLVRMVSELDNITVDVAKNASNAHNENGLYLWDAFEGEMIVLFMDIFGNWTKYAKNGEDDRKLMWKIKAEHVEPVVYKAANTGTKMVLQKGYWFSAHEQWKTLQLPYMDIPLVKHLFANGEFARLENSVQQQLPGLMASVNAPNGVQCDAHPYCSAVGIQSLAEEPVFNFKESETVLTPYAAFPSILVDPAAGLAWYNHMLAMPRVQTPVGSIESFTTTGKAVAPMATWDAKVTTVLAMLGGTGPLLRTYMEEQGVYGIFEDRVKSMYEPVFKPVIASVMPNKASIDMHITQLPTLPWPAPHPASKESVPEDFPSCRCTEHQSTPGNSMTRGTVQLRWPEVAMEVLPNAMDGQADRLDEAMNVLSHLLVDLESELKDIAKNDATKLPPIPSSEGLTNKSGQLDSALNVLNAQLIELENELQKDGFAPITGDGKLEETKEAKIQASNQGEKGQTPKQTTEVLATPLNVVPTMLLRTQPGQPQLHTGVAKVLPGAPVMAQMPLGWRLPDQRLPQAPPQQFQPRTSPRPSRLSQEPAGQKLAVAPPQVASGAAMASAAMSATANMTPSTAPVLTYSGRAISPAPVGTGTARQPATPPPLVLSGSAFRSPSEGRIGAFRPELAKSPMQRQHPDGWRSPAALPTAPSAFPMCRSTPSPRPSVGQGFGNSPAGARLASTHGHARSSWRSPSEGRIVSGPPWGPADGAGQTRTPRFDMAAQSPMRRLRHAMPAMSILDAACKKDAGIVLLCSFLRFASPPMLSATSLMPLPAAFELQASCRSAASILQDLFFQSPTARYMYRATKKFVSFRCLNAWACMKPHRGAVPEPKMLEVPGDEDDSIDQEESPGFGDYRSFRSGELAGELALSLAMASLQQASSAGVNAATDLVHWLQTAATWKQCSFRRRTVCSNCGLDVHDKEIRTFVSRISIATELGDVDLSLYVRYEDTFSHEVGGVISFRSALRCDAVIGGVKREVFSFNEGEPSLPSGFKLSTDTLVTVSQRLLGPTAAATDGQQLLWRLLCAPMILWPPGCSRLGQQVPGQATWRPSDDNSFAYLRLREMFQCHGVYETQAGEGAPSPAPLPHSFTICRSTGSLTSSNPSFYMSAMGGGGFNQAAVPAATYIVDLADPVDQLLGNALRMLDTAAASKLTLRRLSPGRYEIDGRRVTLRWEQGGTGLVVIEDEVLDARGSAMPLVAYLKSAGNVAASLSGQRADMPKIARVPKAQRLTFDDDAPAEQNLASQIEKLGSERCESMRLAVEQARLREEAAEKYEQNERLLEAPHQCLMMRDILLLLSFFVGALASGTCNVAVPDHEQVCDHSTWVCRIVCNAGMLPGMKASKCESEATGLLQKPRSGAKLIATEVNASKGCLSEEDVCDGFCNALMGKEDGHKPVDAQCKEKCMACASDIADALDHFCDSCEPAGYPTETTSTTEEEKQNRGHVLPPPPPQIPPMRL